MCFFTPTCSTFHMCYSVQWIIAQYHCQFYSLCLYSFVLLFTLRFTELYVDELEEVQDLKILTKSYLRMLSITEAQVEGIVQ